MVYQTRIKRETEFGKEDFEWKKKLDDMKDKVRRRRKYLLSLQDKLNEVSDTKNKDFDENPQTKEIRILENKLDKIMIKFNEAQSIKKTYEQVSLTRSSKD
jgi:hypothetical protein